MARGQDGEEVANSMTDPVLVKKDMLHYVLDMRAVRLVGAWIKRREVVNGVRRTRSKKLREHQYREGYAKSLQGKIVKGDGENNVEHMWKQVKWAKVESTSEVCDSVRVGGKNPKSVWWNNEVRAVVKRKETAWKEVLEARDEEAKERCLKVDKEEKKKLKKCIYQSKEEVNEQFGKMMNQNVNGNSELFWKEVL